MAPRPNALGLSDAASRQPWKEDGTPYGLWYSFGRSSIAGAEPMAKPKINFTELTHQVIRESADPLTLDEVVARVMSRADGETTKNLKNTVRGAISQSHSIIAMPDGRYTWKSRMLNGVVHRIFLHDKNFSEHEICLDDLQCDLLEPTKRGSDKYGVTGPARLELVDGPTLEVATLPRSIGDHLLHIDAQFWDWIDQHGAQPGDSLLITAIDVAARRYSLSYEPASARDDEAIAARSQAVIAAAVDYVRHRKDLAAIWDIASHLNVSGIFHQIPAPDPFSELWTVEVWGPLVDEYGVSPLMISGQNDETLDYLNTMIGGGMIPRNGEVLHAGVGVGPIITVGAHGTYQGDLGVDPAQLQARIDAILQHPGTLVPADDPLLPAITAVFSSMALPSPTGHPYLASYLVTIFGDNEEIFDWIEHGAELGMVQIDPAYEAMCDEALGYIAAPPEPQARSGPSRTLVLRVSYRYKPEFWREIEIANDQHLSDLHMAIQQALGWDNDHLYSFYMGKRPYDSATEIGSPGGDSRRQSNKVTIGDLDLHVRQKFLYLFDFGDSHLFDIRVMKINPKAPPGIFPRIVGQHGDRLVQYEGEEECDVEECDAEE